MPQPSPQPRRIIELRKHHRIPTPTGALFSFKSLSSPAQFEDTPEGEGTLINLSLGGCQLISDIPLKLGERYNLILQPSEDRQPISIEAAVVRWTEDKIYGLKFSSLQSDDESRLKELLFELRQAIH